MKKLYILSMCCLTLLCACSTNTTNNVIRCTKERDSSFMIQTAIQNFTYKSALSLLQEAENHCYSPIGIYLSLALLETDSLGTSDQQILNVLHYNGNKAELRKEMYKFMADASMQPAYSLWHTSDVNLSDGFRNLAKEYQYPDIYEVDFQESNVSQQIKKWINEQTNNTDPLEINISKDTKIALINTLHVKSNWKHSFSSGEIQKDIFYTRNQKEINTPFLRKTLYEQPYYETDTYLATYLTLDNGMRMYFYQPKEVDQLQAILKDDWQSAIQGEHEQKRAITLSFPKFKFKSEYNVKDMLIEMGMVDAFDQNKATFTSTLKNGSSLYLDTITQGTYIDVNEQGIEASTANEATLLEVVAPKVDPLEIKLNHPFLFVLTTSDKLPLFVGTIETLENK